jgi:ABC-2 type transport system ATP-binding protein
VKENLLCRGILHGLSKKDARKQYDKLTEILKLGDITKKKYKTLSGGQKRRCEIAAALMHAPKILFLDEPTLGLDVIARSELWDVIRGLKEKMTVILTTHYMEEAEALSDRVGIMKNGRLLFLGTAQELMKKTGSDKFEHAFISVIKEETV